MFHSGGASNVNEADAPNASPGHGRWNCVFCWNAVHIEGWWSSSTFRSVLVESMTNSTPLQPNLCPKGKPPAPVLPAMYICTTNPTHRSKSPLIKPETPNTAKRSQADPRKKAPVATAHHLNPGSHLKVQSPSQLVKSAAPQLGVGGIEKVPLKLCGGGVWS